MPAPLLSILIVCRNPGKRLRAALESVWSQIDAPPHEIVVVDGASRDGTAEWLASVADRLGALHSGPDDGIYPAMNHAIRLARGDWVLFLGADDRLASPEVLARIAPQLTTQEAEVLVGESRYSDGRLYRYAGRASAIRRNFIHHQAAFYRRTLFSSHGGFDESLRIQSDYDHNLRLLRAGTRFDTLPIRIAECTAGGMSDAGRWANYHEEIAVRARYFPLWRRAVWDALSLTRYLRKKIVRRIASAVPE